MILRAACFLLLLTVPAVAFAQGGAFAPGWVLEPEASALRFQSIKNETTVESSEFATFTGTISPEGVGELRVMLDSVDTKVDLRNVRMRFLFFETFNFPEAVIQLRIPPALVADLALVRRKVATLPFTISLHGVTQTREAEMAITLLSDDLVSVATATPISLGVADFNLEEGRLKLQEAANVRIVPSATVSFDFLFRRLPLGTQPAPLGQQPSSDQTTPPVSAALETQGDFSQEECAGRFEILSRAGNIFFASNSAVLSPQSRAILDTIGDVVLRCPGIMIEVGGHTDSDGARSYNQRLSEARAASVVTYFTSLGADPSRLVSRGYGEANPVVPNTSSRNKARNRRIEFMLLDS